MKKLTRTISAVLATALLAGVMVFPGAAGVPGVSPWAEAELAEIIRLGLKDENYYNEYPEHSWDYISRQEFARNAAYFLARQYRFDINSQEMQPYVSTPTDKNGEMAPYFTDVYDLCVNLAYKLGVVQGRGDGIFDPDAPITREEAAVMLYNTYLAYADHAEEDIPVLNLERFEDREEISPWARQAVSTMAAWDVMAGMSETEFGPKSHYTYEQCWVTFLRLYKNAPEGRLQGSVKLPFEWDWEEKVAEFREGNELELLNQYFEYFYAETADYAVLYGGRAEGRYDGRGVNIFYKSGGHIFANIPDMKYNITAERFSLDEERDILYCTNDQGAVYKVDLMAATVELAEPTEA
jgi:hypothetical protein